MKRTITRDQAITELRAVLKKMAGDEHSICFVAAQKGVFCRGFAQWKFHELKEQYPQIVRTRGRLSRAQLERLADSWQLARQFVHGTDVACDTQLDEEEFQTCKGWEEFSDGEIAGFYSELCGEDVEILPVA